MTGIALTTAACVADVPAETGPSYAGATASFLTDGIVQVIAEMHAADDDESLRAYADCAVAEAMALRGVRYARHVRTLRSEQAGIRRADAVYSVTNVQPETGTFLDRDETRAACAAQGIPGV